MNPPQRLHALDNLRAAMMWLGIVLHVSVNHVEGESPLPWRDSRTTPAADLLLAFIHTFRMPVFFILAGFFVAMLVERRGYGGMLKHRLLRLGLPFALFWPPIFAGTVVLAMLFMHRMAHGTFGLDPRLLTRPAGQPTLNTMHLWFLYLLLWFGVATALYGVARPALPARLRAAMSEAFRALGSAWWGALILALPLALVGSFYRNGIVVPNGSFAPPWTEWVHNGLFFVFGLHLYRHQEALLDRLCRRSGAHAAAGLAFFVASGLLFALPTRQPGTHAWLPLAIAFVYNCAAWLWSFALIGFFLQRLPRQNAVLRYLSESSYWVYLVHMLGTVGFGALLHGAALPALVKMGLNILATTLACLLSYQLFVRHTPIGRLLNGRRAAGPPDATSGWRKRAGVSG